MIESDAQMQVNLEFIASMYREIASLRAEISASNERNFQIYAQGPVEQIRRLKLEIDEYLGVKEAFAAAEEAALEHSATE